MHGDLSIKIVGIGGGGTLAVSSLVDRVQNAVCIAMDTDESALLSSKAHEKILLGKSVTRSVSAGGDAELAAKVLQADIDLIKNSVSASDIVFLASSLGGATGSVIAPAVAKIAKQAGALVISFCNLPFSFEGEQKRNIAKKAMEQMASVCDMAVALPDDEMLPNSQSNLKEALESASRCTHCAIAAVCDMLAKTGLINIDFGALKNLFKEKLSEKYLFAYASSKAENKVEDLLKKLVNFPALKSGFAADRASKLIACISCSSDTSIQEIKDVLAGIADTFSDTTEVLFGAIFDDSRKGEIEVLAMGLAKDSQTPPPTSKPKLELPAQEPETKKAKAPLRRERISAKAENSQREKQSEFGFVDVELKRGFFEDTEPNIYGREDLDVPTFMRKKIKIQLKKI